MAGASGIPRDIRQALALLAERGELLTISGEVNPEYEISGIQKALDTGPALLFENIAGYPSARNLGNLFGKPRNMAALFGLSDHRDLKRKCLAAIKNPLPPKVVENAPCQEVVVTDDIDINALLPLIKHSADDGGRLLGGGVVYYVKPDLSGGELSFKRMNFRGKDWGSINIVPGTHLSAIVREEFKQGNKVPLTINIGAPPATMLVAGAFPFHKIVPDGADEMAIAGALQDSPVELCRAKTIDSYAIAGSEWVIEGYCLPEYVFETDAAEAAGKPRVAPFFPEWLGYLGKALKPPRFQVTAITHQADRPIFYTPLGASIEADNLGKPVREACFLETAEVTAPGLVEDINIPYGFRVNAGAVLKVKKRNADDDALVKSVLERALKLSISRLVVAVDDDIDIYHADDILWAIVTRLNTRDGIGHAPEGRLALGYILSEYAAASGTGGGEGITFDATAPYDARGTFKRAHYPSDRIDLKKWLSNEEIARVRSAQLEYARLLGEIGG
jgi:gallate decarboxylase subunit C